MTPACDPKQHFFMEDQRARARRGKGKGQGQGARCKGKGQGARARARGKGRGSDRTKHGRASLNCKNQCFASELHYFLNFARRFEGRCHFDRIFTTEKCPRQLGGFAKGIKAPLSNTARTPTASCLGKFSRLWVI